MKKRNWVLVASLFGCCGCCGIAGFFVDGYAKELAWLNASGTALKTATIPPADELKVLREIQGGEPPTPERLDKLAAACRNMADRTKTAASQLASLPVPARFTRLAPMAQEAAKEMEARWLRMGEAVARRDLIALRKELAETEAFGDRTREQFDAEFRRIYGQ